MMYQELATNFALNKVPVKHILDRFLVVRYL
jgi:hypothetical protein